MQKLPKIILSGIIIFFISSLILLPRSANAGENDSYYDFGVFDYEEGDYEQAEKNFQKALNISPDNPFYNHYMGKTCLKLAQKDKEKYQDAMKYLNKAWETDSEMPGLKYDIAFLNYKLSNYAKAADLFKEVAKEEPLNVLAHYYAGINLYKLDSSESYKEAADYFTRAGEKSPTIRPNGYYYAGICFQKSGYNEKAVQMFEYVKEHADSPSLALNAQKWLEAIQKQTGDLKPYRLFLKMSRRYDDNVKLLEDDDPLNKEDWLTVGYFSGRYNFIHQSSFKMGAGYTHYQSWYDDLDEYNMAVSLFNFSIRAYTRSFIFGFTYLPAYYWIDSESYLRRHQFRPEVTWKITEDFATRLSYNFYDDSYFDNDLSADTNEVSLDIYQSILDKKGLLSGEIGYVEKSSSEMIESYEQWSAKLGISLNLPLDLKFSLSGKYYSKEYDTERSDDKYSCTVSLSRNIFYEWLGIVAEFDYTKNDSNIKVREYERQMTTLSITASY